MPTLGPASTCPAHWLGAGSSPALVDAGPVRLNLSAPGAGGPPIGSLAAAFAADQASAFYQMVLAGSQRHLAAGARQPSGWRRAVCADLGHGHRPVCGYTPAR